MKHAVDWAKSQGLTRVNRVHGETEYRVPTRESYSHVESQKSTQRADAEVEMEAWILTFKSDHLDS